MQFAKTLQVLPKIRFQRRPTPTALFSNPRVLKRTKELLDKLSAVEFQRLILTLCSPVEQSKTFLVSPNPLSTTRCHGCAATWYIESTALLLSSLKPTGRAPQKHQMRHILHLRCHLRRSGSLWRLARHRPRRRLWRAGNAEEPVCLAAPRGALLRTTRRARPWEEESSVREAACCSCSSSLALAFFGPLGAVWCVAAARATAIDCCSCRQATRSRHPLRRYPPLMARWTSMTWAARGRFARWHEGKMDRWRKRPCVVVFVVFVVDVVVPLCFTCLLLRLSVFQALVRTLASTTKIYSIGSAPHQICR